MLTDWGLRRLTYRRWRRGAERFVAKGYLLVCESSDPFVVEWQLTPLGTEHQDEVMAWFDRLGRIR